MDIYFIQTEGWTPNNTVALCADIAMAIVPIGTGAGPAIQVASRGPKAAAAAYAHAAVHVPEWARFGQTGVKLLQSVDGTVGNSPDLGGNANSTGPGSIPGITPPSQHSGLKSAMNAAGNNAPVNMLRPQAHHNLPWKFRDWFAGEGRGLNVNDPQFGRWVEGSPVGRHQNWTPEYNRRWSDFIRANPNATRQEVLDYLDELLASGEFPNQ